MKSAGKTVLFFVSFYESCFYTDDIGDGSYADEYNISLAGGLELYSEVSLLQKKFNQNEKIDINNFNNCDIILFWFRI